MPERHAHADLYSWRDEEGVIHLTNLPVRLRRSASALRLAGPAYKGEGFGGELPLVQVEREAPAAVDLVNGTRYDGLIAEAATKYHLPFALIKAVMKVESNFNPAAVWVSQSRGLMQLIDATASLLSVVNPFDPEESVFAGARYLRMLANMFDGNIVLVAAAYNAGPERVMRSQSVPNIPETQLYVRRVLALYRHYRAREGG